MKETSVVDVRDAVVLLGSFPALAEATLTIDRGELVVVQGANGAGKTTLLRLCAGLLPLARGTAHVMGHDVSSDRAAVRASVGFLGHANGLYLDLTAGENLSFWGDVVGASRAEVTSAAQRMGLTERLLSTQVGRLSAGQKRRTALAVMAVRRATLWLLDEPHAGLDAAGRDEIDALLRDAVAAGATVVVASHELERSASLATRRIEVVGGRIVESGGRK
ncbi:MAG: heme ABC exporter ATP-binding protein CcmA [Acidobacteria bacterium]|nr:heme ABC exporter ATP-binding protein CcmA [Acidobacteriota bacterium]